MGKLIYSAIASADGYVEDADGVRSDLELLDTQSFASGVVYLKYRPKPA